MLCSVPSEKWLPCCEVDSGILSVAAMKQRIITALIAAPVVLALVFAKSSVPIYIVSVVCIFLACDELVRIVKGRPNWVPACCALLYATAAWFLRDLYHDYRDQIIWTLGGLLGASVAWMGFELRKGVKERVLLPGLVWIMAPVMGLVYLHYSVPKTHPDTPWWPNPLLMALVPIWVGDILAIIVGKNLGKRPLWPDISPNKTWEGASANLIGCTLAACALAPAIGLTWRQGLLIGLVGGILGQYGDLFESSVKRYFDAKDSGWIMPGHGGLLDRLDSLLLPALPIAALILFYR